MKKPSSNKRSSRGATKTAIPVLRVKTGASRKEKYAAALRAFTAADLQKFTEVEDGVPAEQVLAELEAIYQEETRKPKTKK